MAVSLHYAGDRAGESRLLSSRLYQPKGWTEDPARRAGAGIPIEASYQSKTDLALNIIDEAIGWEAKPGVVLADEAHGSMLRVARGFAPARGLAYAVRVSWTDHRLEASTRL